MTPFHSSLLASNIRGLRRLLETVGGGKHGGGGASPRGPRAKGRGDMIHSDRRSFDTAGTGTTPRLSGPSALSIVSPFQLCNCPLRYQEALVRNPVRNAPHTMSLSRSTTNELCSYVQDNCSTFFGKKFWDCRLVTGIDFATKADKFEQKIFAISKFRIFILSGKTPQSLKPPDKSYHVLSIRQMQVVNDNELCIQMDESASSSTTKRRLLIRCSEHSAEDLARYVLCAIKHYFPDIGDCLRGCVDLAPPGLYSDFAMMPSSRPVLACHNFRRSYAALCDFYDLPFREEVVWDVEKIYSIHHLRVLRLEDFTHLPIKDLIPIIASLQFSAYFTGILVDGFKLTVELIDVILSVIRRSQWLTSVKLINCYLTKEFISQFAAAIQQNPSIPLEVIDLSKNVLEDKKGFQLFSQVLPKLTSLKVIHFAECGLSEKCVNLMAVGLQHALTPSKTSQQLQLATMDLAGNNLKEDTPELISLLSLCTTLRTVDLSNTGFTIDRLWSALKFGGLQLRELRLDGCAVLKKNKDGPQAIKEYFSGVVQLEEISFAGTQLHPDSAKALLLGLASNQQIEPFVLNLNNVTTTHTHSVKEFAQVLETCLPSVGARSLSLRDNSFEAELLPVLSSVSQMQHLTSLDLGGTNFCNLRRNAKNATALSKALMEIVKLIGEDDSHLRELTLSDCRLGNHLSVILNTLGVASTLRKLDISGNDLGNFGARLLAKALQINVSLRELVIDRNQITSEGFADIAHSLRLNNTLVCLPYPLVDVADALNRPDRTKTLAAIAEIESLIEKNRNGSNVNNERYRTALTNIQNQFSKSDVAEGALSHRVHAILAELGNTSESSSAFDGMVNTFVESFKNECVPIIKKGLEPLKDLASSVNLELSERFDDSSIAEANEDQFREKLNSLLESQLVSWKWDQLSRLSENLLHNGSRSLSSVSPRSNHHGAPGTPNSTSWLHSHRGSPGGDFGHGGPHHSSTDHISRSLRPKSVLNHDMDSPLTPSSVSSSMMTSSYVPSVAQMPTDDEQAAEPITMDQPPKSSGLVHLVKGRPKAARRIAKPGVESTPPISAKTSASNSVSSADHAEVMLQSVESASTSAAQSPRLDTIVPANQPEVTRIQLGPKSQLGEAPRPPTGEPPRPPTGDPPQPPEEPRPPVLPRRTKVPMVPPQLPPKNFKPMPTAPPNTLKEPVMNLPSAPPLEDENANSRRSVADMARMFSSSSNELPISTGVPIPAKRSNV
uniref:Carm_PH domain-containing protein n=1 Tax=Steinernema glaseri TaxID=37863 RepID=A0A1I7YRM4_9BILA